MTAVPPADPSPAHPLLVELQQLLRHLGGVESQSQAMDVELGDDILQGVLQGEPTSCPMLGGCGRGILQDGTPQGDELIRDRTGGERFSKVREEDIWGFLKATSAVTQKLQGLKTLGVGEGNQDKTACVNLTK